MKYERGISLVALVITIIVLVVLAGVSFMAVFGDNGIIGRAMKGKENMELASAKEAMELAWAARLSKYYEDLSSGNANAFYTYFSEEYLTMALAGNGEVVSVTHNEENNTYDIVYKDNNGNDYTINMTAGGSSKSVAVAINKADFYGRRVTTGVTQIGGVNLGDYTDYDGDNWKIFYIDENTVYLIFGDYFPVAALPSTENIKKAIDCPYNIYANTFENKEEGREFFKAYLDSPINFEVITSALTTDGPFSAEAGIETIGTPSSDLWIKSWNEKYPGEYLGCKYVNSGETINIDSETTATAGAYGIVFSSDVRTGYYDFQIPPGYFVDKPGHLEGLNPANKEGDLTNPEESNKNYGMYTNNLYYPRKAYMYFGYTGWITGYWLNDYSALHSEGLPIAYVDGPLSNPNTSATYHSPIYAIRPIVKIPIDEFESATGITVH